MYVMRTGLLFGWGIVIYAVTFFVWSVFTMRGIGDDSLPRLIVLCILAFTALVAGSSLRMHTWQDIFPYSISWMLVFVVCAILTAPLPETPTHHGMGSWIEYALVVLVPLCAPFIRFDTYSVEKWET